MSEEMSPLGNIAAVQSDGGRAQKIQNEITCLARRLVGERLFCIVSGRSRGGERMATSGAPCSFQLTGRTAASTILLKKSDALQSSASGRIPFLGKAFSGIGIRGISPGGTIFYASVPKGLAADFFNNIHPMEPYIAVPVWVESRRSGSGTNSQKGAIPLATHLWPKRRCLPLPESRHSIAAPCWPLSDCEFNRSVQHLL